MSTKTMRPPPRRAPWPNATATATANNNNSTGFISNTSKSNHLNNSSSSGSNNNNNKSKEEGNDVGFQRPKKPQTASAASSPSPKTRLSMYDKLMRAGSDPKEAVNNINYNYNNNKDMKKRKKEEEEEELGSKRKRQQLLVAGYLAHEYLTKGTLLGKRWDQVPSERVDPQHGDKYERYVQLAGLLKTGGAHFPGFVNPTQMARHLRLLK